MQSAHTPLLSVQTHEPDTDGTLALAVNLRHDGDALRPVPPGEALLRFPETLSLRLIHSWQGQRTLLFQEGGGKLLYAPYPTETPADITPASLTLLHEFPGGERILHTATQGHTLAVATDLGLRYATLDGTLYTWLGAAPDVPDIYPYITLQRATTANTDTLDGDSGHTLLALDETVHLPGAWQQLHAAIESREPAAYRPTDLLAADDTEGANPLDTLARKCAESISTLRGEIHRRGLFTAPFYIRAAYRIHDGRHLPASAPVPLVPTTTYNPMLAVTAHEQTSATTHTDEDALVTLRTVMPAAHPYLRLISHDHRWDDIITHLDVYATEETQDFTDDRHAVAAIHNTATRGLTPDCIYAPLGTPESALREPLLDTSDTRATATPRHIHFLREETWVNGTNHTQPHTDSGTVCMAAIARPYKIKYGLKAGDSTQPTLDLIQSELGAEADGLDFYMWQHKHLRPLLGREINTATVRLYYYTPQAVTEDPLDHIQGFVELHRTDGERADDVFTRQANAYLLKSIPATELVPGATIDLRPEHLHLDRLISQPRLEDIAVRPYHKRASSLTALNQRLHIVVGEQQPETPPPYTLYTSPPGRQAREEQEILSVEIKERGQTLHVPVPRGTAPQDGILWGHTLHYYYYPSTAATAITVAHYDHSVGTARQGSPSMPDFFLETVGVDMQRVPLLRHETLPGAYAFHSFQSLTATSGDKDDAQQYAVRYRVPETTDGHQRENILTWVTQELATYIPTLTPDPVRDLTPGLHVLTATTHTEEDTAWQAVGDKLLLSAAHDPYILLSADTVTVPTRQILTLRTAARPLSQGQFGDFTLYAFTLDGVFALRTLDDGTLSQPRHVADHILTSPDTVATLSQSVIYDTPEGLMRIAGSETQSLSEPLRHHTAAPEEIPHMGALLSLAGLTLTPADINTHTRELIPHSHTLYDPQRGLLHLYRPGHRLALLLDLHSGAWTHTESRMLYTVEDNTRALVVEETDGEPQWHTLRDRSTGNGAAATPTLTLTNPLALSLPCQMKTPTQIRLRGDYDTPPHILLQASNDLRQWANTASALTDHLDTYQGTPHKWHRVAILAHMKERDTLRAIDTLLTPRLNNKLR